MHHRDNVWKPFGSERVNESKKFQKSAEKYFYPTFSSFWVKLSLIKLFLIRSEIVGLLLNTLNANYEYSRSYRENLQLRKSNYLKKPKLCSHLLLIIGMYIKFPMFLNKNQRHRSNISEVIDSERSPYLKA